MLTEWMSTDLCLRWLAAQLCRSPAPFQDRHRLCHPWMSLLVVTVKGAYWDSIPLWVTIENKNLLFELGQSEIWLSRPFIFKGILQKYNHGRSWDSTRGVFFVHFSFKLKLVLNRNQPKILKKEGKKERKACNKYSAGSGQSLSLKSPITESIQLVMSLNRGYGQS